MKVYNEDKTKILEEYDLTKGYLKDDALTTTIEEEQGVEEVGHYETIKEYPNGGKDVKWVVDVEGKKYKPAETIVEPIKIYIKYTKQEILEKEYNQKIEEYKRMLTETDYKAIKYAEGWISEEEYTYTKSLRQSYRDKINEYQELLLNLTNDTK